jgi:hypothetical protein
MRKFLQFASDEMLWGNLRIPGSIVLTIKKITFTIPFYMKKDLLVLGAVRGSSGFEAVRVQTSVRNMESIR